MESNAPSIGRRMPVIWGLDKHGGATAFQPISPSGEATILYVFATTCHYCRQNLGAVKALESQTRGRFRFEGVALDYGKVGDFPERNGLEFPVLHGLSQESRVASGLSETPTTLLLTGDGRVEAVWAGPYLGKTKKAIESRFSVSLPELVLQ